jgi:hypothetical protein
VTDAPPPPPAEPLYPEPVFIPAGTQPAGAPPSGPPPYGSIPTGSATRSPVLLLAVAIAAVVGLVVNSIGLAGFPSNAPVEGIYALGIGVDFLAIAIVCGIGAAISRRGYPLRSSTPIAVVAVVFAAAALAAWVLFGGVGSLVELIPPDRGRYMYAAGGLFYGGFLWVLAVIFGAHAFRRGGTSRNNVLAIVALAVPALLIAYTVTSSVIYGLGLTD